MTDTARFAKRRQAVFKAARSQTTGRQKPVDAMLITDALDIRYLTGLVEGGSFLLLFARGKAVLATAAMFQHVAKEQAPGVECIVVARQADSAIPQAIRGQSINKLGYQQDKISLARFQSIAEHVPERKLVPITACTDMARAVKDDGELALTQKCVNIAEKAFKGLIADGKKALVGRTEKDIAAELEYRMRQLGADRQGFNPGGIIVAAGPNSASCHHVPTSKKVKANDVLLFDWGAELDGYRSDITRTLLLGKVPQKVIDAHTLVNNACDAAIAAVKQGVTPAAVDQVARGMIDEAGFGELFRHGLGHGIGLQIHEPPFIGRSDTPLKAGMVITIEPGVYFDDDFGIRLEDDVLVTPTGAKRLNKLGRDLKTCCLA